MKQQSKIIGIWGSYQYGNFGDEAMGIIFANYLHKIGKDVCIYKMTNSDLNSSIKQEKSLLRLLLKSSFILIGGGAMLTPKRNIIWYAHKLYLHKQICFLMLFLAGKLKKCKIAAISIGGDNKIKIKMPLMQQLFFSSLSPELVSVRLPNDRYLFPDHTQVKYIPDILLGISSFYPPIRVNKKNQKIKIGLNLSKRFTKDFAEKLVLLSLTDSVDIYFIKTHSDIYPTDSEFLSADFPFMSQDIKYQNVSTFCRDLEMLDLIISSKLHVGVTALSYNIPFVSLNGQNKTKEFLKTINASSLIYDANQCSELLSKVFLTPDYLTEYKQLYDWELINNMKNESLNHINLLGDICQ